MGVFSSSIDGVFTWGRFFYCKKSTPSYLYISIEATVIKILIDNSVSK